MPTPSNIAFAVLLAIAEWTFEVGCYHVGRVVVWVGSLGRWKCDRRLTIVPKRHLRPGRFHHDRGREVYLTADATQFIGVLTLALVVIAGFVLWNWGSG